MESALAHFGPDVVHLASPVALGAVGLRAARRLGIPTVAVYQTYLAGFAQQYGFRADAVAARWIGRIHRRATGTLVPSASSYAQLRALGVSDVHLWRRGVSLDLFGPDRRSEDLHRRWTGGDPDHVVVGYVGRLAAEKQVRRLVELASVPGIRLVVVGDGPARRWLAKRLPHALFTGMLQGEELARAFPTLDVFVHPSWSTCTTARWSVPRTRGWRPERAAPERRRPTDLDCAGRRGAEWVIRPTRRGHLPGQHGDMGSLAFLAGSASTVLFAAAALPMLWKALATRDLASYSLGNIVLANVGNVVHSVYVLHLPPGPIWALHTFYVVSSALMLVWYLRFAGMHRTTHAEATEDASSAR